MKARRLNAEQLRKLRLRSDNFRGEGEYGLQEAGFSVGIQALAMYLSGHDVGYIQSVLSTDSTETPPYWDIIEATFEPSDE